MIKILIRDFTLETMVWILHTGNNLLFHPSFQRARRSLKRSYFKYWLLSLTFLCVTISLLYILKDSGCPNAAVQSCYCISVCDVVPQYPHAPSDAFVVDVKVIQCTLFSLTAQYLPCIMGWWWKTQHWFSSMEWVHYCGGSTSLVTSESANQRWDWPSSSTHMFCNDFIHTLLMLLLFAVSIVSFLWLQMLKD